MTQIAPSTPSQSTQAESNSDSSENPSSPAVTKSVATTSTATKKGAVQQGAIKQGAIQQPNTQTIVLDIGGMMCAGCVSTVEKKLANCEDVVTATVNLITEVAAVECTLAANAQSIAQELTKAGYPSQVRQLAEDNPLAGETEWLARKEQAQQEQGSRLAIALSLLALSTLGHLQHFSWTQGITIPILSSLWFHGLLATFTLIFPARAIISEGWQGARRNAPNMNTLVSLGALSAYLTSLVALVLPGLGWACFFDEPVMLLSFILLGRTLEERARFQATRSLRSLIALQPTFARLVPNSSSQANRSTDVGVKIPANQVKVGEWLRVLPGEKIPVDGIIVDGQTTINESMLTGESMPVSKQVSDPVFAGSLNQSGAITLQVNHIGTDTTLAQMIQLVETAQTRKAPIQSLADILAGYFTYGVLTCAALTFGFWYFVGVPTWPDLAQSAMGSHMHHMASSSMAMSSTAMSSTAVSSTAHPIPIESLGSLKLLVSLKLAIAVIVVACPCALGLATPTAILVGSGIGAEKGLLIRGGDILEATHKLETLAFDKTGTLTTGSPIVTDCLPLLTSISDEQLLQMAATVESGTRHPLGVAIQQAAKDQKLTCLPANNFQTKAGYGIAATVTTLTQHPFNPQQPILLGNLAWMAENDCTIDAKAQNIVDELGRMGKTAVYIAQAQTLLGIIGVADTLRQDAIATVQKLQNIGLTIHILSGDTPLAAQAIAQQLNIPLTQVQAGLTPQGKVEALRRLQAEHCVGFIGDGINDAPALATADVGIALNSGTEVAMETADIVLMGEDLSDALAAIRLSRSTFNKIRQNLAWAFAYNLICMPLAAGAFLPAFGLSLNPGVAGGLMALSSLAVVLNSLLLRLQHPQ